MLSWKHQDHEDESTAAPKSIEQDRKIVPFRKKAVTFMFHATYGTQIENIMQQGIKPGRTHPLGGRQHVHMACVNDIVYDDQESDAALAHVPKGRDALLILAFARDKQYNIRVTEERTALSENTILEDVTALKKCKLPKQALKFIGFSTLRTA